MAIYLTSDTHAFHRNIVDFCDRPFRTLDGHPDIYAMNRAIIEGWNSRVTPSDIVLHLGDMAMGSWKEWAGFRAKLNGRIILVVGNHDRKLEHWLQPGDFALDSLLTRDGYFLTHAPPTGDDQERYAHDKVTVHPVPKEAHTVLCGHVHEKWATKEVMIDGRKIVCHNVGVDIRGYVPRTLEEIING